MNIAIYCGSNLGNKNEYKDKAIALIHEFKNNNINIVYGGSQSGLMGIISNKGLELELEVIGVITKELAINEIENKNITKSYIVKDMNLRKAKMESLSDAFIALPGGFGTLDEIFEVITLCQIGEHNKPCAFFNVNGYYDTLIEFLKKSAQEGFIEQRFIDMLIISDNEKEIIKKIKNYKAPQNKWFK